MLIICYNELLLLLLLLLIVCFRREYKSSEFELHEVYAIDVIISTGDGKVNNWFLL